MKNLGYIYVFRGGEVLRFEIISLSSGMVGFDMWPTAATNEETFIELAQANQRGRGVAVHHDEYGSIAIECPYNMSPERVLDVFDEACAAMLANMEEADADD